MVEWIDVVPAADFPPGSVRTLEVDGVPVAVFNVGGDFYAIEDICSHEQETLSAGEVEGTEIICPRHFARFSLVSGEALEPPAEEPVLSFPVRVVAGMVQVGRAPAT